MKPVGYVAILGLFALAGCSTMGRPYVSDGQACGQIVDAKERLDCYDRADRAESEWREEKRREQEEKDKSKSSKD
ncbi:MAG: hypothetical protein VX593_03125 [Pseudomonadota bacterium]|nr:hypothetical protein [Pseudomonadota bacterium]